MSTAGCAEKLDDVASSVGFATQEVAESATPVIEAMQVEAKLHKNDELLAVREAHGNQWHIQSSLIFLAILPLLSRLWAYFYLAPHATTRRPRNTCKISMVCVCRGRNGAPAVAVSLRACATQSWQINPFCLQRKTRVTPMRFEIYTEELMTMSVTAGGCTEELRSVISHSTCFPRLPLPTPHASDAKHGSHGML
jgi:hypothetical protein